MNRRRILEWLDFALYAFCVVMPVAVLSWLALLYVTGDRR